MEAALEEHRLDLVRLPLVQPVLDLGRAPHREHPEDEHERAHRLHLGLQQRLHSAADPVEHLAGEVHRLARLGDARLEREQLRRGERPSRCGERQDAVHPRLRRCHPAQPGARVDAGGMRRHHPERLHLAARGRRGGALRSRASKRTVDGLRVGGVAGARRAVPMRSMAMAQRMLLMADFAESDRTLRMLETAVNCCASACMYCWMRR